MQEEIWKDVPDYEGFYQVSNLGRVRSLDRKAWNGKVWHDCKGRILRPSMPLNFYPHVNLRIKGSGRTIKVHVLVAMAFLNHTISGNNKVVVDHINGIKTDNRVENLQLISNRENVSKGQLKRVKSSKYVGVHLDTKSNKWVAYIAFNGKRKKLGSFIDEYEAHLAYQAELKKIISND